MGKLNTLLLGLAAGAGLMYFYDPDSGDRRRKTAIDRVISVRNSSDEAIETGVRDLRNRARGFMAEAMSKVSNEGTSDWVVRERIRSELGTLSGHPGAIDVDVRQGRAYLTGHSLKDENDSLLKAIEKVRGVQGVENRLQVHDTPDDIAALMGPGQMTGSTRNWSPSTRLLAAAGGGLLWLYGSMRGGFTGWLIKYGGLGLSVRGLTNKKISNLVGMGDGKEQGMIDVRKSITVSTPVEEVYQLWENFENFPRFMDHVKEIRNLGGGRSHWVVTGPAGTSVEFDAIITEKVPNELIAWETVPDSEVTHKGRVRFNRQNNRTRIQVFMSYTPPAGIVGHAVASLFGDDPKSAMDEDLARLKSLLEEGKTTADQGKVKRTDIYGEEASS